MRATIGRSFNFDRNPASFKIEIRISSFIFMLSMDFKNVFKRKVTPVNKSKFTEEEDKLLKMLVEKHGKRNWALIASHMPNRNERQCHDRWEFFLSPEINHGPFTEQEDKLLLQKRDEIGAHWVKISAYFKGRTDTMLKNRYNLLLRRYIASNMTMQSSMFQPVPTMPVNIQPPVVTPVQNYHEPMISVPSIPDAYPDVPFEHEFGIDTGFNPDFGSEFIWD